MIELWKSIPGWRKYAVSNRGRVKRLRGMDAGQRYIVPGRVLKPVPVQSGLDKEYRPLFVTLSNGMHIRSFKVAHLALNAFVGPRPLGLCARHLDDNQANNKLGNLKWGTSKQNGADRTLNGLTSVGERNGNVILKSNQVLKIRLEYVRGSSEFGLVALGRKYGVSASTIHQVVHHVTWKNQEK